MGEDFIPDDTFALNFLGPPGPDFRGPPQEFGDPRDRRMPFDPRDPRNREPPRGIVFTNSLNEEYQ